MDLIAEYQKLLSEFGEPVNYWPQWCATTKSILEREKIIIGMILVQRTSWHNANIALKRLREADLLSVEKLAALKDLTALTELIRPAGFFQSKPKRLVDICNFVQKQGGVAALFKVEVNALRTSMLAIKGIGNETADTILLYALDYAIFIIDEYTYRWADKLSIPHKRKYFDLQEYFHKRLKPDVVVFQKFHALIIISQRGREKSMMEIV